MSTFAVGEVAIYWRPESQYHLTQCTIRSPLCWSEWFDRLTGRLGQGYCYEANSPAWPDPDAHPVEPCHLRKRRPPQDWTRLCNLDEAPVQAKPKEVA
jgi:hypothetical protein